MNLCIPQVFADAESAGPIVKVLKIEPTKLDLIHAQGILELLLAPAEVLCPVKFREDGVLGCLNPHLNARKTSTNASRESMLPVWIDVQHPKIGLIAPDVIQQVNIFRVAIAERTASGSSR